MSAAFQGSVRTNTKRTRLPFITPWHHRIEPFRFLSLGRPDVSRVSCLPSSSSYHHCVRTSMSSRRSYSTSKETEKVKLGNGSSSVPKEDHKHDHDHAHDPPHTHSHSLFGHSHSHGDEGHSHGTEQIIAALKGTGTFTPSSSFNPPPDVNSRRQRQSNNTYWTGLKCGAHNCERIRGLVYAFSIAAC